MSAGVMAQISARLADATIGRDPQPRPYLIALHNQAKRD
jgi:hypothetical protein